MLSIFAFSQMIYSLEINKNEMEASNQNTTIEFINYEGPHKIIDSAAAIKGIGSNLGTQIASDVTVSKNTNNSEKYYVIHAVDDTKSNKLDADILVLNKNAGVDHIKNLRRIISGYISAAYGYSSEDSDTLAVFITVYNAVYREKIDYFTDKYKEIVLNNLSAETCGLSTNYEEWPGKTQIVIPLYDVTNSGLSIVDTSVISDQEVINSMKTDDDRNIEARKDMVDLKEREADEAYEKAQNAQKDAVEKQKELAEEEENTKKLEEEAREAEYRAAENPDDEELQNEANEKAQELEDQKQKEEDLRNEIKDSKNEASEQQALSDKKELESQNERKEIAKDQTIVQKEEAERAKIKAGYGVIISDNANLLSQLVKFNKENGEIIKNSPVKVIRNRTVYKTSDKYIAIAGEKASAANPNRDIKLVLLDANTLELFSQSEESVYENSVFVKDSDSYFCVISIDDKWILGKYDENLNLIAKSEIEVFQDTPVTVNEDLIAVTDKNGKLNLLDKTELKVILSK